MDDLKLISQNLLNETCFLRKQIESRDKELRDIKDKLNKLCNNCKNLFSNDKCKNKAFEMLRSDEIRPQNRSLNLVDSSSQRFSTSLKYSLMAGFLVIVCILGTLTMASNQNNSKENPQGRILTSPTLGPQTNSNGVILYKSETPANSVNYPFTISKDIDKYIKKKTDKIQLNEDFSLLKRKRMHFISKMNSRKKRNIEYPTEIGFLKAKLIEEPNNMCVNVDNVAVSIQLEDNLVDGLTEESQSPLILKNESEIKSSSYNGVVPVKGLKYNYESSILRDNIKSMYCKDFITTAEENGKIFKNLFDKVNMKIKSEEILNEYHKEEK